MTTYAPIVIFGFVLGAPFFARCEHRQMLKYLLLRSRGWWIYTEGGGKLALALVDPARVSGETAGGGRCGAEDREDGRRAV